MTDQELDVEPRITLRVEGEGIDNQDVRLDDFAAKVTAFLAALRAAEGLMAAEDRDPIYYRVVDLKHASPSAVIVAPIAPRRVTREAAVIAFSRAIRDVSENRVPLGADAEQLTLLAAVMPTTDGHISKMTFETANVNEPGTLVLFPKEPGWIDLPEQSTVEKEPHYSYGSVAGRIEWINIHASKNKFYLYPTSGGRIACVFPNALTDKAIEGVKKYARIEGRLKFRFGNEQPSEVVVSDIDIYEDASTLPSPIDLRGIAPGATDGMNIRDFVESLYEDDY